MPRPVLLLTVVALGLTLILTWMTYKELVIVVLMMKTNKPCLNVYPNWAGSTTHRSHHLPDSSKGWRGSHGGIIISHLFYNIALLEYYYIAWCITNSFFPLLISWKHLVYIDPQYFAWCSSCNLMIECADVQLIYQH